MLISGFLSDLLRSRTDLLVENALLCQQLIVLNQQVKRPALTNSDRFRLVFLSQLTHLARIMNQSPTWIRHHIKLLEAAHLVEISKIRRMGCADYLCIRQVL